jgi:hypothetical protein
MTVRFKKDTIKGQRYIWNACFRFDIPFQKGYYEITAPDYWSDCYTTMYNYKWINLESIQRTLIIKENEKIPIPVSKGIY